MAGKLRGNADPRRDLPVVAAARKAHMAQLRAIVAGTLSDNAIDDFLRDAGEHIQGSPPIRLPQGPYEQAASLRDSSRIRLASSPRLALVTLGDKVSFNAHNKNYSVPAYVQPALALLNDQRAIPLGELCAMVEGGAAVANLKKGLAMLVKAGVVLIEN